MKIEVYDCTEKTDAGTPQSEITEEQLQLIEDLGLEGQKSLIKKAEAGVPAEICPYRQMTAEEHGVYHHLLTSKVRIEGYSGEPIPLRVLQVAAHAKSLGLFDRLEVWSTKGASEVKDPVLVARRNKAGLYGDTLTDLFLLARWGEELEPLAALKPKAAKIARASRLAQLEKIKGQVDLDISRVISFGDDAILVPKQEPTYYSMEQ